ncbi:Uncharacterised protein [Mycobacteroides abscessus subsp. abscessus]|nr:Uncharacterised protein [Mycobacteroides abscessus subsp. abscessus]
MLRHWASTISSVWASMASASLSSACWRKLGVDLPQDSKARSAAATAAFTSSRLETGARPTTDSSTGLIRSIGSDDFRDRASTNWPSM